jgi:hypothetical protein
MGIFDIFSGSKSNSGEQASALAQKAPIGASGVEYAAQFSCADVFTIEPKPLDVGIPRSKALKGRVVTLGSIKGGEFAKGDMVALVKGGTVSAHTKILDLIPFYENADFNTELNANMHKTKASFGNDVWLILDVTGGVDAGDLVAKV